MEKLRSWALLLFVAVFLAPLATGTAAAQDRMFTFDAHGGIAVPVSDGDVMWDAGPSFGGAFTYWFNPSVGLRGQGAVDLLSGASAADVTGDLDVPDLTLFHYTAGLEFRALDPDDDLLLNFLVGAGATSFSSDDFPDGMDMPTPEEDSFSESYVTVNGGVKLGYRFHENVSGFLGGNANLAVTDEDDFAVFSQLDPENPDPALMGEFWTFPFVAGVEFTF